MTKVIKNPEPNKKNARVTNFKELDSVIRIEASYDDYEVTFYISRARFENWLTDGKGVLEYVENSYDPTIYDGHRQTETTVTINEWWDSASMNDEEHLQSLTKFINTDSEAIKERDTAYYFAQIINVVEEKCNVTVADSTSFTLRSLLQQCCSHYYITTISSES